MYAAAGAVGSLPLVTFSTMFFATNVTPGGLAAAGGACDTRQY